jgi:hypothetical protein
MAFEMLETYLDGLQASLERLEQAPDLGAELSFLSLLRGL